MHVELPSLPEGSPLHYNADVTAEGEVSLINIHGATEATLAECQDYLPEVEWGCKINDNGEGCRSQNGRWRGAVVVIYWRVG